MIREDFHQFPIDYVRERFPALKRTYNNKSVIYLDGAEGSQMVRTSIEAVSSFMSKGRANPNGQSLSSKETINMVLEGKESVAAMFDAKGKEVIFCDNTINLQIAISKAMSANLKPGDEIVVSEMDSRENVEPWLEIAREKGLTVRWFKVNMDSLTIDLSEIYSIITEKTRIVSVGFSSNSVGTVNEVEIIANRAKAVGAVVVVDAASVVPHFYIEYNKLDADIFLCSSYNFFGPNIGIAIIRENIFEKCLEAAPDYIYYELESGTRNYEAISGVKAAIDFIASIGKGRTDQEKIMSGIKQIEAHENRLINKVRKRLSKIPKIMIYQSPEWVRKTPTVAFRLEGMTSQEVCKWMAEEYAVFITDGYFYTDILVDKLGLNKVGGWIGLGISAYNREEDIEIFINAIKKMVNV